MSDTTSAIHPALPASRGMSDLTRQILDQRLYAVLATENDDGSVHLAPVMFLYADERILIETSAATRKAHNVDRRWFVPARNANEARLGEPGRASFSH